MGANYMLYDGLCSAVGTLLLSKFVAESFYEHNTGGGNMCCGTDPCGSNTCCGPGCFRDAHLTIAIVSATCVVSSLAVLWQTRPLYAQLIDELRVRD
jgi:hypothetical protein